MADVFISYKKENRALAERVIGVLRAEGLSIWWDNDLTPRHSWDAEIEREALAAKAIVVLWTEQSVTSEWVRIEADFAKQHGKLVPLMLEPCELPLAFRLTQAADLSGWSGQSDHHEWQRCVAWIKTLCREGSVPTADRDGETAALPVGAVPAPSSHSPRRSISSPVSPLAWIALAGIAVLILIAGYSWTGRDTAPTDNPSDVEIPRAVMAPERVMPSSCPEGSFYDITTMDCFGCAEMDMLRTIMPIRHERACVRPERERFFAATASPGEMTPQGTLCPEGDIVYQSQCWSCAPGTFRDDGAHGVAHPATCVEVQGELFAAAVVVTRPACPAGAIAKDNGRYCLQCSDENYSLNAERECEAVE